MSTLAVIPARGGSKGIVGKNVRILAGKPLIAWAIEAALHTPSVDRVIVSTDDPVIGQIAEDYDAEVVARPAEISGDDASSESALLHVLGQQRIMPDTLVMLQCTSPLTIPEDIEGTIKAVRDGADCAFTAAPFHRYLWRTRMFAGVLGVNHDHHDRLPRQKRTPNYVETGAVYAMRTEGFLKAGHRFFGRIAMHVVPAERSMEIDEPADLIIAAALLEASYAHR